jgi:hypothetical protein
VLGALPEHSQNAQQSHLSAAFGADEEKGLCVMVVMKKRTAVAVTMGVWAAALGSAAALTYELNRPLHWVGVTSQFAAPIRNTAYGAVAELGA